MHTSIWLASCWTALVMAVSMPAVVEKRQANSAIASNIFRRRGYMSTAVLKGWAYIDGGEFSYTSAGDSSINYSNTLIAINLSQNWTNSSVTIQSISKPSGAPNLDSGGIWVDQNNSQIITGFAGRRSNLGDGKAQTLGLWAFKPDGAGGGSWTDISKSVDPLFSTRPRQWSSLVASGGGFGYSLGGFYVNASSSDSGDQSNTTSGLIVYDMSSHTRTNLTVNGTRSGGVIQMGGMVYVPNFGSKGVLVVVGGDQVKGATEKLLDFTTVSVFDVAGQKWYDQTTTGNIPSSRKEFCTTGLASNNGTYEILVYAGWNGNLGSTSVPYDEAFVLTLPGFNWFKATYPASSPRHALSCVPVGGGQILTVGGVDTTQQGSNLYTGTFLTKDPLTQGLGLFDMSALAFTNSYAANAPAYTQAKVVANYYATNARTPKLTTGLSAVLAVQNFNTTDSTTDSGATSGGSNSSSSSNAGAIAGGVVGGVILLAFIAFLVWFLRRRKNRKAQAVSEMSAAPAGSTNMTQNGYAPVAMGAVGGAGVEGPGAYGYHEADGSAARHEIGGESMYKPPVDNSSAGHHNVREDAKIGELAGPEPRYELGS